MSEEAYIGLWSKPSSRIVQDLDSVGQKTYLWSSSEVTIGPVALFRREEIENLQLGAMIPAVIAAVTY